MGSEQDRVAPAASTGFLKLSKPQCDLDIDKAVSLDSTGDVQGLCSDLSSSRHNHLEDPYCIPDSDRLLFTHGSKISSTRQHLQQDNEYFEEHSTTPVFWEDIIVDDIQNLDYEQSKFNSINNLSSGLCSPCLHKNVDQSGHQLWKQDQICHQHHLGKRSECFNDHLEAGFEEHVENKENVNKVPSDMGESSIISDILSLELDPWEDSLAKFLGESEEPSRALKASSLRKGQDKNQSRFSFARQDDLMTEASDLEQSIGITRQVSRGNFASDGLMENKDTLTWKYLNDTLNGKYPHVVPSSNYVLSDKFVGSESSVPSKFS